MRKPQRIFPAAPTEVLGGVCAGLSYTLNLPVGLVRFLMILASLFGVGIFFYFVMILVLPVAGETPVTLPYLGDSQERSTSATAYTKPLLGAEEAPSATLNRDQNVQSAISDPALMMGGSALVLLGIAGYVLFSDSSYQSTAKTFLGLLCLMVGYGLAWWNVGRLHVNWWMCGLGGAYVILGAVPLILSRLSLLNLLAGFAIVAVVLLLLGIMLFPLWVNLRNSLLSSQLEQIRSDERAAVAAHLHDSVMQTLTLIQSHPEDAAYVARLARREERQLRAWLYPEKKVAGTSVKDLIERVTAEVEDACEVNIETVIVGDYDAGEHGQIMESLVREACMNAAKHGAEPISVYVECGQQFEAFVKDQGPGFSLDELEQIPTDRHGVRDSLLRRAQQVGGSVKIRRLQQGTEVAITVPWAIGNNGSTQAGESNE
ncbi:hypothetical protein BM477_02965 [Boudabousia marimammalium]|uniref:Uncharacterized protein n=1 Tax=Boudabousia marimammalium TaxID=156892 RepID=A0A1Q5PS18_9ACTO|nr:hypothetical protein BM477_02965 [Boudabousia marimammalium]